MLTRKIIKDLDAHLTSGNHYPGTIDSGDNSELNKTIIANWRERIEKSLVADFRQLLSNENLQVEQTKSIFYIVDNDAQGATIWKSFVTLTDNKEKLDVVVNFVVNGDNAFIYLGASHASLDNYSGTSEILIGLFKQLKTREKVGQFFHTKFYDLDLSSKPSSKPREVNRTRKSYG